MAVNASERIPISKAHLILETGRTRNTVGNWVRLGLKNKATGEIVKLKTRRNGGGVYTTKEWYESFQDRLNEGG